MKSNKHPKYINIDGKNKKIPKLVYGHHEDVIKLYFNVPIDVRKRWRQIVLKATDILTFGPLKGKKFQSLIASKDEKIKLYYRDKFLLASTKTSFVKKVADSFNPFNNLPPELEVRIQYIN